MLFLHLLVLHGGRRLRSAMLILSSASLPVIRVTYQSQRFILSGESITFWRVKELSHVMVLQLSSKITLTPMKGKLQWQIMQGSEVPVQICRCSRCPLHSDYNGLLHRREPLSSFLVQDQSAPLSPASRMALHSQVHLFP